MTWIQNLAIKDTVCKALFFQTPTSKPRSPTHQAPFGTNTCWLTQPAPRMLSAERAASAAFPSSTWPRLQGPFVSETLTPGSEHGISAWCLSVKLINRRLFLLVHILVKKVLDVLVFIFQLRFISRRTMRGYRREPLSRPRQLILSHIFLSYFLAPNFDSLSIVAQLSSVTRGAVSLLTQCKGVPLCREISLLRSGFVS